MRFNKILLPLDGSELAEKALAPALALAEPLSAEIVLLRVVVPLTLKLDKDLYQRIIDRGQKDAKAYLNSIQLRSLFSTVRLKGETVVGKAADSIINYAQENEIDLIVMSSHGRSGINRWVYGSVADKVLYQSTCPTAIIHPQAETAPFAHKRILVPLDGSEMAETALTPALHLAQNIDGELVLLRVVDIPPIPNAGQIIGRSYRQIIADEEQQAANYLQKVKESLAQPQLSVVTQVASGPAAETIVDYADKQSIGLVVMSSHGRSRIGRWVFGSVTEKTLRGTHCATLIIR